MRILLVVTLALWGLTLLRTIVNLLVVPRLRAQRPLRAQSGLRSPRVSVIIPARDEERAIERTVRGMLAQQYTDLEIIVVDDRSSDGTGRVLEDLAEEDSRLRVLHGVEPPEGWLGKPWALHQGSLLATGELLLFVDADVAYEPDAVASAVHHFQSRDIAMLALLPRLRTEGFWEHVLMPNLAMTLFAFLPLWMSNLTRLPRLGVGGGTGNLVLRSAYQEAGGHEALRDAVIDDVGLARLLRRSGARTEVVRAEQQVSVRMYHGGGEVIRGFTKNTFAALGYSYVAGAVVFILSFVLHVFPYVVAATGDPLALAIVGLITITRIVLFVALGDRLDNAVLAHPLMVTVWAWILLRSMWITGIRRQVHWRGRIYDAAGTRFGAD